MRENEWIAVGIQNQTELAKIIGGGELTDKIRVRAHRLWNDARLHEEEILTLYHHTGGELDANKALGIPTKKSKSKKEK